VKYTKNFLLKDFICLILFRYMDRTYRETLLGSSGTHPPEDPSIFYSLLLRLQAALNAKRVRPFLSRYERSARLHGALVVATASKFDLQLMQ
jgi:hypothetical protein